MLRNIVNIFIISLLLGCTQQSDYTLNVLHTNDLHSHILPFDDYGDCEIDSPDCLGGFARIITFMHDEKQKNPNSLILDAGDRFTGTAFYTLTKSRYLLPLFKMIPYDAATLGNHEFDDNLAETIKFISQWQTPILASNIISSVNEPLHPYIQPSIIVQKGRKKIGIIGVTTPEINILNNAEIKITDIKQSVAFEIEKLKQKHIDIIILLSHIGLQEDIKLAKAMPDIDIIIGGHSHSLMINDENNVLRQGPYPLELNQGKTLIVSSGMGGQYVGKLNISFNQKGEIIDYNGNSITMSAQIPNNSQAQKIIETAQQKIEKILNEKIVQLPQAYGYTAGKDYCSEECGIGEYLTHLLAKEHPEVDGILINSGAIRSALPKGWITYNHLIELYPYDNPAVIIELSGEELQQYINHGLEQYQENEKTNELLQTSQIKYTFSLKDKTVKKIRIKNKPLDLHKKYLILTSLFLANGGDRYPLKSYQSTGSTIREILKKQLKKETDNKYKIQKNVQVWIDEKNEL